MKYIISGTNRPKSRTLQVAHIIKGLYQELQEPADIIDLQNVPLEQVNGSQYYEKQPAKLVEAVQKTVEADGLIVVCPEYNGSMPGALKYFIDHWRYPDSYEFRPICLVGLGGRFGGLRPVEHLQQVFGYRNAFIYPLRVFMIDVNTVLKDGEIHDAALMDLLRKQAQGFCRFTKALNSAGLDANSLIAERTKNPKA